MDSDSAIANVLEVLVPLLAVAILGTPVVISSLKGRWWMGVVGIVGVVGGFSVLFGSFGIAEPSAEFQETITFQIANAGINIAFFGGLFLLIYSTLRSARPGSWWDRNRGGNSTTE